MRKTRNCGHTLVIMPVGISGFVFICSSGSYKFPFAASEEYYKEYLISPTGPDMRQIDISLHRTRKQGRPYSTLRPCRTTHTIATLDSAHLHPVSATARVGKSNRADIFIENKHVFDTRRREIAVAYFLAQVWTQVHDLNHQEQTTRGTND
jgi:hypothetical protein